MVQSLQMGLKLPHSCRMNPIAICRKVKTVSSCHGNLTRMACGQVGEALMISILDLTGDNPLSRLPRSEYRDTAGVRAWIKRWVIPRYQVVGARMDQTAGDPVILS